MASLLDIRRSILLNTPHIESASGDVVSFNSNMVAPFKQMVLSMNPVQEGTGDPSPTNIRPISGWTEENTWIKKKNLWTDDFFATATNPMTLQTDPEASDYGYYYGYFKRWGNNYNSEDGYGLFGKPINFGQLTVSFTCYSTTGSGNLRVYFIYDDGTRGYNSNIGNTTTPTRRSKTSSSSKNCIGCYIDTSAGINAGQFRIKDVQIESGGTLTDYEAPQGTKMSVTWSGSVGTVYGGTLDLLTGVLTVNDVGKVFDGSESWVEGSGNVSLSGALPERYGNGETRDIYGISNYFPSVNNHIDASWARTNSTSGNGLQIRDYKTKLGVADFTAFEALLAATPLQIVYKLATPRTYQLTAHQMNTLLGMNTVWSDAGSIALKYWKH